MGTVQPAEDVKLFAGILFDEEQRYQKVKLLLAEKFGEIDWESPVFDFTFTKYYAPEMGEHLKKQFISFKRLIRPEDLIDIKLFTNDIEQQFAINGKRNINIDPGYLTNGNIVLATTKNFCQRIYLGKGIYGDVHLLYMHNKFHALDWTYPDYKQDLAMDFFINIREKYRETYKHKSL